MHLFVTAATLVSCCNVVIPWWPLQTGFTISYKHGSFTIHSTWMMKPACNGKQCDSGCYCKQCAGFQLRILDVVKLIYHMAQLISIGKDILC